MAHDELSQSNAVQPPMLTLRCKDCGKIYFVHVLAYPIDEDSAVFIAQAVKYGDVPHISTEVTLQCCQCDKPFLNEDEED